MKYTEFKELVRQMRSAQRVYFMTRNQRALVAAKVLEQKVDDQLKPQQDAKDH